MKRTQKFFLLCAVLFFSSVTHAQSCDPWITEIYQQIYNRRPTAQECNIKNYNNGSWNSKCELTGYIASYNRNRSGEFLKGDPWIFQAFCELYSRAPQPWELNIRNYNEGSWSSYDHLKALIREAQKDLSDNSLRSLSGTANGKPATAFVNPKNTLVAINLVSPVGGNVVAAGGANVMAASGASVVAAGGLNLQFDANTPGITFGSERTIQSAGTKVIQTAGKTKLVIR